jgi:hypothetical protein
MPGTIQPSTEQHKMYRKLLTSLKSSTSVQFSRLEVLSGSAFMSLPTLTMSCSSVPVTECGVPDSDTDNGTVPAGGGGGSGDSGDGNGITPAGGGRGGGGVNIAPEGGGCGCGSEKGPYCGWTTTYWICGGYRCCCGY